MAKLIRIKDLEKDEGIKQAHGYQLVKERKIPFIRIGRAIFFDHDEIKTWLKKHKVSETED